MAIRSSATVKVSGWPSASASARDFAGEPLCHFGAATAQRAPREISPCQNPQIDAAGFEHAALPLVVEEADDLPEKLFGGLDAAECQADPTPDIAGHRPGRRVARSVGDRDGAFRQGQGGAELAATEVETDHAVEGGQQVHAVAARLAQGHGPAIGLPGRRRTRPLRCRQRRAQGDAELGLAMVTLGIVRQLHQTVERRIEMGDRLGHGRPVQRQPACPQPVRN